VFRDTPRNPPKFTKSSLDLELDLNVDNNCQSPDGYFVLVYFLCAPSA